MNYFIPILLIIIVCIFDYLKLFRFDTRFNTSSNSEFFKIKPTSDQDIFDLYVITLGKEERMLNIRNQQSKINKKINIFNGINGLQLDVNNLKEKNILAHDPSLSSNENHSKREIGAYLSHIGIYKEIKKNNKDGYTIIFEDDFLINSPNLLEEVKKSIQTLNDKNINFDFLFLGNTTNNYGEHIADNLYNLDNNNNLYGLYGYLVNNKNIDKIIDNTSKIDRPIDNMIQDLSYINVFNTIIINPHLINHEYSFKSTVRNTENVI